MDDCHNRQKLDYTDNIQIIEYEKNNDNTDYAYMQRKIIAQHLTD